MGNQNHNKTNEYNNKDKDKGNEYEDDIEEWEGNKYSGVGIKRMKSYKCNLNLTQLENKRNIFWKIKSKDKNFINWSIIQKAITLDEQRDIFYLQHFKIEPINNCIKECRDKEGNIYKIPNYCINDPYFERELNKNNISLIEEKIFEIKVYRYGNFKPFFLRVKNTLTGKELKEKCCEHEKLDNNYEMKIIIYGVEIKEEEYLYQHNLTENKIIYLIVK